MDYIFGFENGKQFNFTKYFGNFFPLSKSKVVYLGPFLSSLHGKNKYWEIYMTECSTFKYVQKLLKTRSTVLVQLDQ